VQNLTEHGQNKTVLNKHETDLFLNKR